MIPKTPHREAVPGGSTPPLEPGGRHSRRAAPILLTLLLGLLAAGSSTLFAADVIPQSEPDDSFSTAEITGLTPSSTGLKVAYGNTTDGPYGTLGDGDGSGDFDFYKLTAAAGQVLLVDLKNNGLNADFDSFIGVYNSSGTVMTYNDDAIGHASRLTYTIPTAGDYYVVVSNWINSPGVLDSLPTDPTTPGTGLGPPGGTGGPYKVFIGLNANAPILQYDGLTSANPVPTLSWFRTPGDHGHKQVALLSVANTGTATYSMTNFAITGTDAAKFSIDGPTLPTTLAVGAAMTFQITYNGDGVHPSAQALLDLTGNDPLNIDYPISVTDSFFTGGGYFSLKQVNATSGTIVNSLDVADSLLAGTNAASTATKTYSVINFSGQADQGFFGGDVPFPNAANGVDNFATQATGTIYITKAGTYTFRAYSNDGDRLLVDGQELFETVGANQILYGTADLTVGTHTIQYTQFDGTGADHAELSVSQIQGTYDSFSDGETTWELLEAYSPDTDGDDLPDVWEIAHGLNPNSATGSDGATGDPDADSLNNLDEYIAGTDPKNADTDGDGLKDNVETNTGVWVSATDTGTDPLNPDTDGDGLKDGVEDPTKASTGLTQTGTDPNDPDTDGDGYSDLTELTLGSNPKLASSVPALTYQTILADNFDGVATNSTYAFASLGGSFTPAVTATGVGANGKAAQLTSATQSNNNSIAWNQVATGSPQALQLTYDFRLQNIPNPADGLGIGLFRTSAYNTTGALNPAIPEKDWEDPTSGGGFPNAVALGFGIYGTNYIRLTGPAAPGVALSETVSPFTLTNNLFNRAILTAVTSGAAGTSFSLEIIEDVNGTAIHHPIFSNVLVPGFNLPTEQFRLLAGGRTGGLDTRIDLDNVKLATAGSVAAAPTISIARPATGNPVITYTGVLQSSADLITFTDVAAATSPYTIPAGSPAKMFYRSRQP